jgi:predicted lipoprotein with Yx(FWY)xxD motif
MIRKIGKVRAGLLIGVVVAVAVVAAALAGRSNGASSASAAPQARKAVVKTAMNTTLHKTILVTRSGRTLYSLTAETRGKFICTDDFCRSLWTPLVVPRGTTPTGARHLATVKRPDDGHTQVTYRGRPLYTFKEDRKPGDVKGNGFKDVGTWLAASPGAAKRAASPPPSPGYDGYDGYGG